jgi:hypothetical protein
MSFPPKRDHSENDHRSHYHASKLFRSKAKQQSEYDAQRNRPENEPRRERHTDKAHHEKGNSNNYSSKLRIHPHDSPWTGVLWCVVILHSVRFLSIHYLSSFAGMYRNCRNIAITLIAALATY